MRRNTFRGGQSGRSIVWVAGAAVAGAVLTACGTRSLPIRAGTVTTTGAAQPQTSVAVAAFADMIAQSPLWATVRRLGPSPSEALFARAQGYVAGTLAGVEPAPLRDTTTDVVFGQRSAPAVPLQVARVNVLIQASDTWAVDGVRRGDIVAVPIALWLGGTGPPSPDAIVADLVARLKTAAPVGIATLVMAESVTFDGGRLTVVTPGASILRGPSAVAFDTTDVGIASLDWLVGADAGSYYGVTTTADLAERIRSIAPPPK